MAVEVFLTTGAVERHDQADAAQLDGPVFIVSRRDSADARVEVIRAYPATAVIAADVYVGERLTDHILGGEPPHTRRPGQASREAP